MAVQVFSRFDGQICVDVSYEDPCTLSYTSDQIAGLEWVFQQRNDLAIAAVNMSLAGDRFQSTCDSSESATKSIIDQLRAADIATLIASGNAGLTDAAGAPACISSAISVGATTDSDLLTSFSNSASYLDVLAPGQDIVSSVPGSGYASFNGTSMATPLAAGAWAALKEQRPAATVTELEELFESTGVPVSDTRAGGIHTTPRIDMAAAAGIAVPGLANDDRADALPITALPSTFETITTSATSEPDEPQSSCTASERTVWYAYTASQALDLDLTTAGSSFDTALAVYDADTLAEIGCNDDADFAAGDRTSSVRVALAAGQHVLIQAGGFGSLAGALTLSASSPDTDAAPETLTVDVTGPGRVTSNPNGIDCGAACQGSFPNGSSVTLTASASVDATFVGWDDACAPAGGQATCTVLMSEARTVSARFESTNASTRPDNDDVATAEIVTALPFTDATDTTKATNQEFEPGLEQPECLMDKTVWYRVDIAPSQRLSFDTAGSSFATEFTVFQELGGSQVAVVGCTDGSFPDPAQGFQVENPTAETLKLLVQVGGARGQGTSSGDLSLSIRDVTPVSDRTLAVTLSGAGDGGVTSNPTAIDCPGTCSATFPDDSPVSLTANPATGSAFAGWGGACASSGTSPTCSLTLTADTAVVATFSEVSGGSPPDNDDVETAAQITQLPFTATVDTSDATTQPDEEDLDVVGCEMERTVWYAATIQPGQRLAFDTAGSDFATELAVMADQGPDGLAFIACTDDALDDPATGFTVTNGGSAAAPLLMRVGGARGQGAESGQLVVNVADETPTATLSPRPTATPTPAPRPTATATPTPAPRPTATATPTPATEPTATPSATASPPTAPTATSSPTASPSVTPPPPSTPPVEPELTRLSGPDRFATAARISATSFGAGVPVAYVATGANFPDALTGGPVAGASGAPILLVAGDVPTPTADELRRLQPGRIVILGGPAAVPQSVEQALGAFTAGSVTRISGADRFATAAQISASHFTADVDVAYIATGSTFPDALAGGPPAGLEGGPVLLVAGDVPRATAEELERLRPRRIVVLGGTAAVPVAVEEALRSFTPGTVSRLSGASRFDTAAAIVAAAFPGPVETVYIATGANFPDALTGVPPAIGVEGPLLLVAGDVPAAARAQLVRLAPSRVVVLGGTAAVPPAVEDDLRALLGSSA